MLGDAYRMGRLIGQGGMGSVYEATQIRVQRPVAVKVLRVNYADDPQVMARFKREAMLGARLGHDHIVEVMDFNKTREGFPYLVMELLEGQDLQQLIKARGRLSLEHAAALLRQVAMALVAAHDEGVVHRDLKPENIFICRLLDGQAKVKVLDFGISKVLDSESIITHQSALLGTPHFMSPEQAEGHIQQIDHRTDIFALGIVFYYMLSGRLPFAGPSLTAIMYDVVHSEPKPLGSLRPELPERVVGVVERAIRKDRSRRHQSATELLDDLSNAMGDRWNDVLIWSVTAEPQDREPVQVAGEKSYRDEAFLPTMDPSAGLAPTEAPADEVATMPPMDSEVDAGAVGPADTAPESRPPAQAGRWWKIAAVACGVATLVLGGVLLSRSGRQQRVAAPSVALEGQPAAGPPARQAPAPPAAKAPAGPTAPTSTTSPDASTSVAALPIPTRSLTVRSIPRGAVVRAGKKSIGVTPVTGQIILHQSVKLEIRKRGYAVARHRVPAGEDDARVLVKLTPLPATLSVVALHRGNSVSARVYLDGKYMDETPGRSQSRWVSGDR